MINEYYNNGFNSEDIKEYKELIKLGYSKKDAKEIIIYNKKVFTKENLLKLKLNEEKSFSNIEIEFIESFFKDNQLSLLRWIK